jgi:hypothetical protein
MVGATGFEPATTCTPSPPTQSVNVGRVWQLFARRRVSGLRPQRPTSILLSDELKAALRKRGQELGVGYQTAVKMILAKYVNAKP